jgi:radical SAM superfamily enzyme YgiQ (UPF0313 family)
MKILCVNPSFPRTFWGAEYTLPLIGRKSILPPLGLLTIAALLPSCMDVRLCDLNVRPLSTQEIQWADAVFVSGMLVQRDSLHEVAAWARAEGKPVVAGGPYASTSPDVLQPHVDCVVVGEAEELMEPLVAALKAGPGHLPRRMEAARKPDLTSLPVPRFDLLDINAYQSIGVQWSRGCPYTCEFCDIIEIYGRRPRTKTTAQFLRELEAVRRAGYRGSVFVVDDNFIGNRPVLKPMLAELASWNRVHGDPFDFYTEASVNLAADDGLIHAMVEAGFTQVFIGIETPSEEALRKTGKLQNTGTDLNAAVDKLVRRGLEVMAGFIVGFDSDDADAVERQRRWIADSPIPLAMVGILIALPGTQLWRRLEAEDRLISDTDGNHFARPNFVTRLEEAELLERYAALLESVYTPRAWYERCERALALCPRSPARFRYSTKYAAKYLARAVWHLGIRSPHRAEFWRFIRNVVSNTPRRFPRAIALALHGEHMVRYTAQDVIPQLKAAIQEARRAPRAAVPIETIEMEAVARAGV